MKRILLAGLALGFLAGCGAQAVSPASTARTARMAVRSDEGLRAGVIELRKQRFSALDFNTDGFITPDEVTDENLVLPGIIKGFGDYDLNKDGKIEPSEFLREDIIAYWCANLRPEVQRLFAKSDKNGDGVLTGKEIESIKLFFSIWPSMHGGDLNQDGKIPYSEYEDAYLKVLPHCQQGKRPAALRNL